MTFARDRTVMFARDRTVMFARDRAVTFARDRTVTFAEGAARAAGLAGVAFGWTPAAFWAATPAELGGVVRAMTGDAPAPCDAATIANLKERYPDG